MRIAAVDDDNTFRFLITELLKKCDIKEIITFANGQKALSYFKKNHRTPQALPHVLFLDLNMPILDGWGFLEQAGAICAEHQIEVWVISCYDYAQDVEKAQSHPAVTQVLVKPVALDALKSLIQDYQATHGEALST